MRAFTFIALAITFSISTNFAVADEQAEALKIVQRGLKALGGKAKLEKLPASTWEEKGTYHGGTGAGLPYTGKYAIQWPDQFRMEIKDVFVIVLNGDKGWTAAQGEVTELDEAALAEQKEEFYAGWLSSLVPLSGKEFTLATIDESKVEGQTAVGVKVTSKNHRDVELFFDKESGLLIKVAHQGKSPEFGDKLITKETFLSKYEEINGIQVPMKVVLKYDGKLFVEGVMENYAFHEKLDNSTFDKPKSE